jgi:hypothetical protein
MGADRGGGAPRCGSATGHRPASRHLVVLAVVATIVGCTDRDGTSSANLTYPDLRTVPARPVPEDTLAEREAIADDLLRTRAEQNYEREALRYRVGLAPSPPAPPAPVPGSSAAGGAEEEPQGPSDSLAARYLRQQIDRETNQDSLNDFLSNIAQRPVDLEPLAAGEAFVPEDRGTRSRLFSDTPDTDSAPSYPDWNGYRPLLDRALGVGPGNGR